MAIALVDWRVVLFAALISAAAAITALQTLAGARDGEGARRTGWLLMAGAGAAAGIWATHFLTIRAYQWAVPVSFDPTLVATALLVAVATATLGLAIAANGERMHAIAGGAVVGLGLVLTHVVGMKALDLPAVLHRAPLLAVPVHVFAVALCSAALLAHCQLGGRRALAVAAGLLSLAIVGVHMAAVAGIAITADPSIAVSAASIGGSALSALVACTTAFIMVTVRGVTLMSAQSSHDAQLDLRRRHQALQEREAELSRQNVLFDVALASLPHGLCMVDADQRLLVCNKRYADMYGLPPELTRSGTDVGTLVQHQIATGIYAGADPQGYHAELLSEVAKPTVKTHQLSGGRFVMVSRRPMPGGGWIAVHEDITERRRLQETEREAKETLAAIFDAVPTAVVCVAADRRVMLWSRGAELIFGYTAEETVGQPFKLVPAEEKAKFDWLFDRALGGETLRDVRAVRRRKDGSLVDISFSCAAMRDRAGAVRGIVYALDDLTEWEQLAARLEAQNDLLKQREEAVQRQNDQLDTALATMVQGLAMFDAQERLVLANARYAEFFGLTPEEVTPGMTLDQIVELRTARGCYPGMSAEEVLQGMRGRNRHIAPSELVRRPGNGRVLSISVQPRPDGGWVTTLHDISEDERLKKRLQEQNEQLDAALNNMSQGLAMFDAEHRLVMSNRHFGEMYGLSPQQTMPGVTVRQIIEAVVASGLYQGSASVDQLASAFGRKPGDTHRLRDGRVVHVAYQRTANGGYVVTYTEAGARERLNAQLEQQHRLLQEHEEKLQARNNQLDAAINNMPQGLAMFDAEQRLIICNQLYADMYGLTPEQVKPGTTVRQIFDYRLANGFYHVKDSEQFVDSWASNFGKRSSRVQELADGRIIAVSRAQLADGGRVVTHEDISERQKLNAQLEQQHRLLQDQEERLRTQNLQLDAALNNMMQGLAMFDADQRVIIANDRYAELYNLTPEQVKPGTHLRDIIAHRIANGELPGASADEVLQKMLARVAGSGSCHFTMRMHDDRSIVVSAKPMADGCTVTTHQDITEQRRSEAKIVHMALHDALTGLPNRILFNERLEHALARARRGEVVAVHLLDLDHFKHVNDTLGHPAGDKLLKAVTERLRTLVRETDIVARMGGDEFAIVQGAIPQPADAGVLARRVIDVVSQPYDIDGNQVMIGASVGIAVALTDGGSTDQLMRNADLALYRAKGDGRGMFCFFEPGMDAKIQERRAMEYDMRRALVAGQFELFYQPVVNLQSNKVSGLEALIRWRHPERGLISPAQFIPLAEEIGFIVPLGEWAIRQACATAARWPSDVKVAVNLSAVQFRSAGLVQTVVNALAASGLPPTRLELEITETTLLHDSETVLAMLYQLRELGVGIAMDDFGAGYSSLSYLQRFPFNRIKIDRSFIKDIGDGVGSLNIVRAVAALAKGLGMETTAEGVESQLQRDTVASEGCTEMQGFLFSKPLPVRDIERLFFPGLELKPQEPAAAATAETPTETPNAARAGVR